MRPQLKPPGRDAMRGTMARALQLGIAGDDRPRSSRTAATVAEAPLPCGVVRARHGVVVDVNRYVETLIGRTRDQVIGAPLTAMLAVRGELATVGATPRTWTAELVTADGALVPVFAAHDGAAAEGEEVWIVLDAREHREREIRAQRAARFEVVGQLAAGVAHEINSPSQYISDAAHFARDAVQELLGLLQCYEDVAAAARAGVDASEPLARLATVRATIDEAFVRKELPPALDSILEGAARVSEIVRAMKELTHGEDRPDAPADLNAVVESVVRMTKAACRHVATVQLDLGKLPPLVCAAGELAKALVNLVVNARDAILEAGRIDGRIDIRTRCLPRAIEIEISDNGIGIPVAVQQRVFEPYFTTKAIGVGTGQGLALVRAVVEERHGGRVLLCSEHGVGTTFRVLLPLSRDGEPR
ncbi:MAG: hypothetical protein K1X88_18845 [Nannocystaceae bacterium]|nr:hypothetical protein [Nannocystaceae bacterium]